MAKIPLIVVMLLFSVSYVVADVEHVTLFYDGFESGSLANWTLSGTPSNGDWAATLLDVHSGLYKAYVHGTGSNTAYMEINISTVNATDVSVTYAKKLIGLDAGDDFWSEWSDGNQWHYLEHLGSDSEDDSTYQLMSFNIGPYSDNNPSFAIRFGCSGTAISESCNIDDVLVRAYTPVNQDDFSITAQGISETEVNQRVENTWVIVSPFNTTIVNASCSIYKMNEYNATASETQVDESGLDMYVNASGNVLKVYWDANESLIDEGSNYEVDCSARINGIQFDSISQFVYVNRLKTIFDYIDYFVSYIMQMFNITRDTNQLISGEVSLQGSTIAIGQLTYATAFVSYADGTVDDADCYLSVWYPNASVWISDQTMIASGVSGRYTYLLAPYFPGSYPMQVWCNGTSLENRTNYARSSLTVSDMSRMEMIS